MHIPMNYNAINFVLFQIGWFACVLGAANDLHFLGVIVSFTVVAIHLYRSVNFLHEAAFIAAIALLGFAIDSGLVVTGYFSYENAVLDQYAPMWIAALWALFATTIGHSMSWLFQRRVWATILGAIFGPLAYYSASKLGAVNLLQDGNGLYLQSLVWAILMPLMLSLYGSLIQQVKTTATEYSL